MGRSGRGGSWGRLKFTFAAGMSLVYRPTFSYLTDPDNPARVLIHELGHVYTWTNGISKNEVPLAVGWLFLQLVVKNHATRRPCPSSEIYAAMAEAAFWGGSNLQFHEDIWHSRSRWRICDFSLDRETRKQLTEDLTDITRKVFFEQEIPQWFYDEYQEPDGSIDLDKLWADVAVDNGSRAHIVYALRNEFGGYCSQAEVSRFVARELDSIDTPWRDAGNCPAGGPGAGSDGS